MTATTCVPAPSESSVSLGAAGGVAGCPSTITMPLTGRTIVPATGEDTLAIIAPFWLRHSKLIVPCGVGTSPLAQTRPLGRGRARKLA
jgi:hypothetical protein